MNLSIWIVTGALLGLMMSLAWRVKQTSGFVLYLSAGVAGAVLGGLVIAPQLATIEHGEGRLSLFCFIVSIVTAIVVLNAVRFLRLRRSKWVLPKNSGF